MSSTRQRIVVAVVVVVVAAIVFVVLRQRPTAEATAVVVRRTVTETAVMSGRVIAARRVELGVSQPGVVTAVNVDEGQEVADGDVLVQLDDRLERAAVAQAKAQVQQANAQLQDVVGPVRARAVAAVAVAAAQLAQAEQGSERLRRLLEQGAATVIDRDNAATATAIARAQHARAKADLDATADGGTQVALARAAVAVASAQTQQAEARLSLTRLEARSAATVLVRAVEPGEAVSPGRILLSLAPQGGKDGKDGVEILVEPDERVLSVLAVGQAAVVSADAFADRVFGATVTALAPVVDKARGTVEVRLLVDKPPAFLRTDMTVSVEVTTGEREGLVVAAQAVRGLSTETPTILVVDAGHARERAVTVVGRGRVNANDTQDAVVVVGRAGAVVAEGDVVVLDSKVEAGAAIAASTAPTAAPAAGR